MTLLVSWSGSDRYRVTFSDVGTKSQTEEISSLEMAPFLMGYAVGIGLADRQFTRERARKYLADRHYPDGPSNRIFTIGARWALAERGIVW